MGNVSVPEAISSKVEDGPDKGFIGNLPTSMTAADVQGEV